MRHWDGAGVLAALYGCGIDGALDGFGRESWHG